MCCRTEGLRFQLYIYVYVLWFALLSSGEGWHNDHHVHPTSARPGLAWYEIDINWRGIRVMQFLGPAKAIKLVMWLSKLTLNAGKAWPVYIDSCEQTEANKKAFDD